MDQAKGVTIRQESEKPQNGLKGLKYWKKDLIAAIVVAPVAITFSLAISVASGTPYLAGPISAIIAGLIMPLFGGSYVAVGGPAAGLAPVILAAIMLLGHGDKTIGYPLMLVAVFIAGILQVITAKLKLAGYSKIFSHVVTEGMFAAIGFSLFFKQIALLTGASFHEYTFFGILFEIPSALRAGMNSDVMIVSFATLAVIFISDKYKPKSLQLLPSQIIGCVFGVVLSLTLVNLDPVHMLQLPPNLFDGFRLPDFAAITNPILWLPLIYTVIIIYIVDGGESLVTIAGVDRKDPYRRKSDPDRTLLAIGVSNVCSSAAGGITVIPGVFKSSLNIMAGAVTQWSNFFIAVILTLCFLFGQNLMSHIPLGVLAAVVTFTGYKMFAPHVWRHIAHIGKEQLIPFTVTIFFSLWHDLLWGLGTGMLAEIAIIMLFVRNAKGDFSPRKLFGNPVVQAGYNNGTYEVHFNGPLVCLNLRHLENALNDIPGEAKSVQFKFDTRVKIVDNTSMQALLHFKEEAEEQGREVCIEGLKKLDQRSEHPAAVRLQRTEEAYSFD